ncbi:MAG: glyoxylate/hydroxypyruvate reductase A [Betaproteobacteria bacterium]
MRLVLSVPPEVAALWHGLFEAALPGAHVELREPGQAVDPGAIPADFVAIYGPCETVFTGQRGLKAVFALSAGIGHLLALPGLPRSVPLIRLEDAGMATEMIRYVQAAALRFVLRLDTYARQQREANWVQQATRAPSSLKAGVMGLGVIGAQVAQALVEQGFAVRGYAQSEKKLKGVQVFAGKSRLDAFLDGLNVLVSVLPATPATDGILNRQSLSRLADGAHVVNIGRGAALVDDDLVALVERGKLSGATLDVFREEPLPSDHLFWRYPEIVVTPHISGITGPAAAVAQVAGKIAQLERGEPVSGIVAFEKGY